MIENIKKNIEIETGMLREIALYNQKLFSATPSEKKLLMQTIEALRNSLRIINDSIPDLLSSISLAKKLPGGAEKKEKLEKVSVKLKGREFDAIIPIRNREKLLKELSIGESYIKRLKRRRKKESKVEEYAEFKAARGYLKLANKLFLNYATHWINKGYFKNLSKELRKANIDLLFQAYVAMIFLTVCLSIIASFFIAGFLLFFNASINWPFFSMFEGDYLTRLAQILWIPIITPIATFLALYYYPITEKKSLSRRINQELPFAVIHMSAVSGSGIQPSEIFRIIGLSREYPYLRKEIRKIINQINLYGYDLVTALNNTAATTPSGKLAELFSGLATTITSGGDFAEFFNKRAETLLINYRLEREKYAKTAETFMDVYISVVIAAPMVLMLFLILLSVGSFDIGLGVSQLTLLIIAIITIINVFFLAFIHINQPEY